MCYKPIKDKMFTMLFLGFCRKDIDKKNHETVNNKMINRKQ